MKQARKNVRDARDLNKIDMRAVIKFPFLQGKVPKEIQAILTETLTCFLPGRAKELSAPLYYQVISNTLKMGTQSVPEMSDKILHLDPAVCQRRFC